MGRRLGLKERVRVLFEPVSARGAIRCAVCNEWQRLGSKVLYTWNEGVFVVVCCACGSLLVDGRRADGMCWIEARAWRFLLGRWGVGGRIRRSAEG